MADVELTAQKLSSTETAVTDNSITTGNTYQVDAAPGGIILEFRKTGASNATITVVTPGTVDGLAIADRTFQVDASTGKEAVWLAPEFYRNGAGQIEFTTDEGTDITVAVFKL